MDNGALEKLKQPFSASDIEWRVQRSGAKSGKPWAMVMAYVTARAIQDRLDDACGAFNWRNTYKQGADGGVMCGISIKDSEGKWVTKWDGAENTNIEAVKGGISGAFKRAGAVWGIGRYLYNLEATFAVITENGKYSAQVKETKQWFKWNPPQLPSWALPIGEAGQADKNPTQGNLKPQKPHSTSGTHETKVVEAPTEKQLKAIYAISTAKGFTQKPDQMMFINETIGIDDPEKMINTTKDLTKKQAGQVISALGKLPDAS